jgi:uncharacterized protein
VDGRYLSSLPGGVRLAEKKISAKAVVLDIRAGMPNGEIGRKYGLSAKGIRSLFDKLLSANLLSPEEHKDRVASTAQPVDLSSVNGEPATIKTEATGLSETPYAKTQVMDRTSGDNGRDFHNVSGRGAEFVETEFQESAGGNETEKDSKVASTEFIDVSGQGKNQWWRYLASMLFMFIFPVAMTAVAQGVFAPNADFDNTTGRLIGVDPFGNYVLMSLSFVLLLIAIFLAVRIEHKRPFLRLITPNRSINWKKLGKCFGLYFLILAFDGVISYAMSPATFQFTLNPSRYFMFAPIVLVLTSIQTTTEEILFRGYLLQMTALLTKSRGALVLISGVLFMLPHLANPEMALGFLPMCLSYFACGCFLTFVTLRSNGLEVAMGIHAATNLFAALIVNYSNSALTTESIFVCTAFNPTLSLLSFCIGASVFYLIMFGRGISWRRRRSDATGGPQLATP